MSTPEQVSADRRRQQIPMHALAIFEDTTNEGLSSMTTDQKLDATMRIWARSELEWREAYGVLVDFDPATFELRRQEYNTAAEIQAAAQRDERRRVRTPRRNYSAAESVKQLMRERTKAT